MGIRPALALIIIFFVASCGNNIKEEVKTVLADETLPSSFLMVLGTAQDAGAPQLGCQRNCCDNEIRQKNPVRVVSLALIDNTTKTWYLYEATPDITSQIASVTELGLPSQPEAVFITHAHIGHYTGLMYFGREVYNSKDLPVYTMPRMASFLAGNGPWSQLIELNNISLRTMENEVGVDLGGKFTVTPILVPHRDEFSETVGFKIEGPEKSALFIPDIDKWHLWENDVAKAMEEVDYAFLDATFYSGDELPNREISEIPHPLVLESTAIFDSLPEESRKKIFFIHFNHTNPLLDPESDAYKSTVESGYGVSAELMKFPL